MQKYSLICYQVLRQAMAHFVRPVFSDDCDGLDLPRL
jgi:hypothetical protein